jgi:hypothetical protein
VVRSHVVPFGVPGIRGYGGVHVGGRSLRRIHRSAVSSRRHSSCRWRHPRFRISQLFVAGSFASQGGQPSCGIPSPTAKGVFINVVAVAPSAAGHLTVYPWPSSLPLASTLNFSAGQTIANGVLIPICNEDVIATCDADFTVTMGPGIGARRHRRHGISPACTVKPSPNALLSGVPRVDRRAAGWRTSGSKLYCAYSAPS